MPISDESNKIQYQTNGLIREFSFKFKFFQPSDLIVSFWTEGEEGVILEEGTEYEVIYTDEEEEEGGFIVLKESSAEEQAQGVPKYPATPKAGVLLIARIMPLDQQAHIRPVSGFPEEVITNTFDKLVMIDQQQQEQLDRCVKVSEVYDIDPAVLVKQVERIHESIEDITFVADNMSKVEYVYENGGAVLNASEETLANANAAKESEIKAGEQADIAETQAANALSSAGEAKTSETNALIYANDSKASAESSLSHSNTSHIWAEGTDAEVQALGGDHSAKEWAKLVGDKPVNWGNLIGDIKDQTDLQEELDKLSKRSGFSLFDRKVSDHILEGEEALGWALQGTWVYKEAIAGVRFGYPSFYEKCLEEYNEATTKVFDIDITGNLNNNNGIFSGFSVDNYAIIPKLPTNVTSYEIVAKFKTGEILTGKQQGIIANSNTNKCTPQLVILPNEAAVGIQHPIDSDTWSASVTAPVEANKTYWVKCIWDGSVLSIYYKDNEDNDYILSNSLSVSTLYWTEKLAIGIDGIYDSSTLVFGGSIDLNECYININGSRWWDGVLGYANSNGHKFYNIANKLRVDEIFNTTGLAWLYGIDEENERIFLPRNKWFEQMTLDTNEVGDSVLAGLPNITADWKSEPSFDGHGAVYVTSESGDAQAVTPGGKTDSRVYFDASRSNAIYGGSETVQPNAVKNLLYICVGNAVADTSWINVVEQVQEGVKDIQEAEEEGLNNIQVAEEEAIARLNATSNALNHTQISNCLLEVPQSIKLELNDGTLTLKAGSKVIVPNGVGVFDEIVVSVDKTATQTQNENRMYFYNGSYIEKFPISQCHSGETAPTGATYMFWFDTTNNLVKKTSDGGTTWETGWSLPFAICTATEGALKSIDQVFNGFGYIGKTIWVDKGVKGLIPNGRNADGTLNNALCNSSTVDVFTLPIHYTGTVWYALGGIGNIGHSGVGYIYDESKNVLISKDHMVEVLGLELGQAEFVDGNIKSLKVKSPFKAVDYNVISNLKVDGAWQILDIPLIEKQTVSEGQSFNFSVDVSSYIPSENGYEVSFRVSSNIITSGSLTPALFFTTVTMPGTVDLYPIYGANVYNVSKNTKREVSISFSCDKNGDNITEKREYSVYLYAIKQVS